MDLELIIMIIGFSIAAYSIVANDAIQTLGTFLILTVFVTTNLEKMLTKSLLGYLVAFVVAMIVYRLVVDTFEKYCIKTADEEKPAAYWTVLQWASTGFLWSQWLTQDLANIFVYAPSTGMNEAGVRTISKIWLIGALIWLAILHAYLFYSRGGVILFVFQGMSTIPMSITWVFLGLLAGREFAIAWLTQLRSNSDVLKIVGSDLAKASLGLVVSVALAFSAPYLKNAFETPHKVVEGKVPEVHNVVLRVTQLSGVQNEIKNP